MVAPGELNAAAKLRRVSWTTSGDDLHHSIDSLGGITEIDLKEAACVDD